MTTTIFSHLKQGPRGKPGDPGLRGIQGGPVSIVSPLLDPPLVIFKKNP